MYLDNQLVSQNDYSGIPALWDQLVFGSEPGINNGFKGLIDNARIFNFVLPGDSIHSLYTEKLDASLNIGDTLVKRKDSLEFLLNPNLAYDSVIFYTNGTPTGYGISQPYGWTYQRRFNTLGTQILLARAYLEGETVGETGVTIQVKNNLPEIQFYSPAHYASYDLDSTTGILFEMHAGDPDGFVQEVLFYVNDTLVGTGNPEADLFSLYYYPEKPGKLYYRALAIDNDQDTSLTSNYFIHVSLAGTQVKHDRMGEFQVFPNPAQSHITVSGNAFPIKQISFQTADGKRVKNQPVNRGSPGQINISGLKKGWYFMIISTKKHTFVKKVLIQ